MKANSMFGIFGIVIIAAGLLGIGAGADHVAENGLKIDVPAVVSK